MQDKESFFINLFPDTHIGDDGAVIGNSVYSKDLFCEDVHFKREWMSPEQIAYKSMLVNISDAIAMNARPRYALLGVMLPSCVTTAQMEALASGFKKASEEYDFKIIGGDTVAGEKINISVTIISETETPLLRKGIKKGDLIAYTGDLGTVARDLKRLFAGEKVGSDSKFITPTLRADFIYEAAPFLHAGLDISDGLSKDLSRLSKINGLGFTFTKKIEKEVLCSGEEYEMLIAFAPENRKKVEAIAQKHETPLNLFATAVPGRYETICPPNHFRG
jgi:thiamine-monophosphate kinase